MGSLRTGTPEMVATATKKPKLSPRSGNCRQGGAPDDVELSSPRNALPPPEGPCPARPKRARAATDPPGTSASLNSATFPSNTSARTELVSVFRDRAGTQIEQAISSPEHAEMRPDAFASRATFPTKSTHSR